MDDWISYYPRFDKTALETRTFVNWVNSSVVCNSVWCHTQWLEILKWRLQPSVCRGASAEAKYLRGRLLIHLCEERPLTARCVEQWRDDVIQNYFLQSTCWIAALRSQWWPGWINQRFPKSNQGVYEKFQFYSGFWCLAIDSLQLDAMKSVL